MPLTNRSLHSRPWRGRAASALLAAALGLAGSGAAQGAGASAAPDSAAQAGSAVRVMAPANNLQAGPLAMDSLRLLIDQFSAALAGHPAACAGGAAVLCALLPSGAEARAVAPVLGGCELDGATPLCRVDLLASSGGGARLPTQHLELAWRQGRWVARADTWLAGLRAPLPPGGR